jgi:DNA-binding MarR family transcriptional regulator
MKRATTSQSLQSEVFLGIHRLFRRLQQRNQFVDVEPQSQLTLAEAHLLKQVVVEPELTQVEYKKLFSLPQSHIGRIIDRLIQRGLLIKRIHPKDARYQVLSLTEKGKQAVALSDKVTAECYLSFSRLLSSSEKKELTQFFKNIADGYGHPQSAKRPEESEYSLHQRRVTRCFRLLGKGVFNSQFNSTQWHLLSALVESALPLSPSDLADKIGVSKAAVTSVLKGLAHNHLIESRVNKLDKRAFDISITDEGRKAFLNVECAAALELQKALRNHSLTECERWYSIFKRYVIDSDETIAIPLHDVDLVVFQTKVERMAARARLITALVQQDLQEYCPATLVADENLVVGFASGSKVCGLFDIARDGKAWLLTCGFFANDLDMKTKRTICQSLTTYLRHLSAKNRFACVFEPLEQFFT